MQKAYFNDKTITNELTYPSNSQFYLNHQIDALKYKLHHSSYDRGSTHSNGFLTLCLHSLSSP